jgi:hypothetical protein
MKARFQFLGFLFLCSFITSCSSAPSAPERTRRGSHAAAEANPEDAGLDELDDNLDASAASAPNAADVELFTPKPKTRYQVIQEGFDRASLMPTVNDFDPLDEPSPRIACYSVKAGDPSNVSEMVIKQMMVQIAGSADYGPLFPGSLDHVETRLVIGKNNGWVNSQNLTNEMRQVFELAKAPGSLVIKINENKFGIYQDIGAPAEIWIRKDMRNHIFFKVYRLSVDRVRTEVFIGYCYQRGVAPEVVR